MKTVKYVMVAVVAVECVLAWVHAPFVSLPFVVVSIGAIGLFWLLGKMYFAQLADRRDERRAWVAVSQMNNDTFRYSLGIVTQASLQQQQVVNQLIGLGATLHQLPNGKHAARLPEGYDIPVESVEAEYWQEIAPGQAVAGYLPHRNGRN